MIVVHWEGSWRKPAGFVHIPSSVDVDLQTLRKLIEEQIESVVERRMAEGRKWDYRFLLAAPKKRTYASDVEQMELGSMHGAMVPVSRNQESDLTLSDLLFSTAAVTTPTHGSPVIVLRPCLTSPVKDSKKIKNNVCIVTFVLLSFLLAAGLTWLAITMDDMDAHRHRPNFNYGEPEWGSPMPYAKWGEPSRDDSAISVMETQPEGQPTQTATTPGDRVSAGQDGQMPVIDTFVPSAEESQANSGSAIGSDGPVRTSIDAEGPVEGASAESSTTTSDRMQVESAVLFVPMTAGLGMAPPRDAGLFPGHIDEGVLRIYETQARHHCGRSWIRPLFALMESIVYTVRVSVQGYFVTFRYCWNATGSWMVVMINAYLAFLTFLVDRMLQWPTTLVLVVAVSIALHYATKMIRIVIPYKYGQKECTETTNEDDDDDDEESASSDDEDECPKKANPQAVA